MRHCICTALSLSLQSDKTDRCEPVTTRGKMLYCTCGPHRRGIDWGREEADKTFHLDCAHEKKGKGAWKNILPFRCKYQSQKASPPFSGGQSLLLTLCAPYCIVLWLMPTYIKQMENSHFPVPLSRSNKCASLLIFVRSKHPHFQNGGQNVLSSFLLQQTHILSILISSHCTNLNVQEKMAEALFVTLFASVNLAHQARVQPPGFPLSRQVSLLGPHIPLPL